MEFTDISLRLLRNGNQYDVAINVDTAFREEFGMDFNTGDFKDKQVGLAEFIQSRFPNIKLRFGKVMMGGMLLTIFTIQNPLQSYSSGFAYTVKNGDSIYLIAQEQESTLEGIRAANQLENDYPEVGRTIWIPREMNSGEIPD